MAILDFCYVLLTKATHEYLTAYKYIKMCTLYFVVSTDISIQSFQTPFLVLFILYLTLIQTYLQP